MGIRKNNLQNGLVYHVFNKSIAGFKIFNSDHETMRMTALACYYQREKTPVKFSQFIRSEQAKRDYLTAIKKLPESENLVQIIAYCIMPTHFHFILKQIKDNGIATFIGNVQNSYAKYFNTKIERSGPLWVGRFKNVFVETDEQILHLTRYIHLNPVTSYLVNNPEDWKASSYCEYIEDFKEERICFYEDILDIDPKAYKKFVLDRAGYQRDLKEIKECMFD